LYQDHEGVHIQLRIPFAGSSWLDEMKAELDERIRQAADVRHVWWHWQQDVATMARASEVPGLAGIRNIIAVASGKARPHGQQGTVADPPRDPLGRARLPHRRYAAGNR
ncbi:MAG: hypothetical protein QMB70_10750, partial [Aeromonadaceae bacterium]